MKITINTLDKIFDVSDYVDIFSISWMMQDDIDTFDSGEFFIPIIKDDMFNGIDLSRPFPSNSIVEIESNDMRIQAIIADDLVTDIDNMPGFFSHKITLIEPIKLATGLNIPGITITQPKSSGIGKTGVRSVNTLEPYKKIYTDNRHYLQLNQRVNDYNGSYVYNSRNLTNYENKDVRGEKITAGKGSVKLNNMSSTNLNPDIIDGLHIKEPGRYNIAFHLELLNNMPNDNNMFGLIKYNSKPIDYSFSFMYVDENDYFIFSKDNKELLRITMIDEKSGNLVHYSRHEIKSASTDVLNFNVKFIQPPTEITHRTTPGITSINITRDIIVADEVKLTPAIEMDYFDALAMITFRDDRLEINNINDNFYIQGEAFITKATVVITKIDTMDKELTLLDALEKSVLLAQNGNHIINISDRAKALLKNEISPEYTFDINNLYEVIRAIADNISAKPKMTIKTIPESKWVLATEKEFNDGENKLYIEATSGRFINELNLTEANRPYGYVAKRIVMENPEAYEVTQNDYFDSRYIADLSELNYDPAPLDIIRELEIRKPNYGDRDENEMNQYTDIRDLAEKELVIKVPVETEPGAGGTLYYKLRVDKSNLYAKSIPTGREVDIKEIDFIPFDEQEKIIQDPPRVEAKAVLREYTDYVSAIELNTSNIINNDISVDTGWIPLQSLTDGTQQITSENIGLTLPAGDIYMIDKIYIKGRPVNLDGVTLDKNYIHDITNYVVEESYYNTLPNKSEYTLKERLEEDTKNQYLFYKQGDNKIYGMAFTGTRPPSSIIGPATEYNRAIQEVVNKAAVNKYLKNTIKPINDNGKYDEDTQIRIKYKPYYESRASIYKDDQSGFSQITKKYYNEGGKLNDMDSLFRLAQNTINRMGNTAHDLSGSVASFTSIPPVGSKDSNNRLLKSITINPTPNIINYNASYVQDYGLTNDYIGVESGYRQYEIPKDDIVTRYDRVTTKLYLSENAITDDYTPFNTKRLLIDSLFSNDIKKLEWGRINTYDSAGVHIVDVLRPVITIPTGKGFTQTYKMKDNYGAGLNKFKIRTLDDKNKETISTWIKEIEYSNIYGRVESATIEIGNLDDNYKITDDHPLYSGNGFNSEFTYDYIVKKDSRETMALINEILYFSDDQDKINIYEGIGKYNKLVQDKETEITNRVGILNRKLSKSIKKIDPSDIDGNATIEIYNDYIEFNPKASGLGYVIYNEETFEPLFTYYTDVISGNKDKLYFNTRR